jgi:hypothetical protein
MRFYIKNLMPYISSLTKNLGWIIILICVISPAAAHNIQVKGDVAGLWHVDPNHSPKAGEKARAWVALTRKGGKILPLSEANCQMAVFSKPRKPNDKPILQPTVQAINAEKYQGIPGAFVVFPNTGLYQLQLSCTPKTPGDFRAFEMSYDVTVATAATEQPTTQVSPQTVSGANTTTKTEDTSILPVALPIVIGLGVVGIAAWFIKKR